MTTPQLSAQLQTTMTKQAAVALARQLREAAFPVRKLINLCFAEHPQVAFHAAWILEQLCWEDFDYFFAHFYYFADKFPAVRNASAKRHFAKIMAYILQRLAGQQTLAVWQKNHSEAVVEAAFEWLIEPAVRTGVKVWCIDILAHLSAYHAWVREELSPCLEAQLYHASQGLRVRIKKIIFSP